MALGLSVTLSGGAGKSYRNFPSLPFDLPLQVAPVRGPKHTRVERHSGHVINDEFKGILVTRYLQTVGELAQQEETNPQKRGHGDPKAENNESQRNPRDGGLQLAKDGTRTATDQDIEILLPALPHRSEGAVHSNTDDSLPRTKPQAQTGGLGALREGHVFEHFCGGAVVATDQVVSVSLDHQELPVCGSSGRRGIVHGVVGEMLCQ